MHGSAFQLKGDGSGESGPGRENEMKENALDSLATEDSTRTRTLRLGGTCSTRRVSLTTESVRPSKEQSVPTATACCINRCGAHAGHDSSQLKLPTASCAWRSRRDRSERKRLLTAVSPGVSCGGSEASPAGADPGAQRVWRNCGAYKGQFP